MFDLQAKIRTNGYIGKLMAQFFSWRAPHAAMLESLSFARAYTQKNTPENYTYPALIDLIA